MRTDELAGDTMNKEIMEKLFPGAIKRIEKGQCSICSEKIKSDEFRDEVSLREFQISGMCQSCQDKTFS